MLYVRKYGGTSLADGEKIGRAARSAAELVRQGHRVLLVVSAQGHIQLPVLFTLAVPLE